MLQLMGCPPLPRHISPSKEKAACPDRHFSFLNSANTRLSFHFSRWLDQRGVTIFSKCSCVEFSFLIPFLNATKKSRVQKTSPFVCLLINIFPYLVIIFRRESSNIIFRLHHERSGRISPGNLADYVVYIFEYSPNNFYNSLTTTSIETKKNSQHFLSEFHCIHSIL